VRNAYFSLGSNMGDRGAYLREGVRLVAAGEDYRVSSVFETAPWGGVEQDNFWNLVLEVTTALPSDALFQRAQAAEAAADRQRVVHWGPRTLDVDVLLVGHEEVERPDLVIPHPRMWQRRFVLAPLAELRSDLVTGALLAMAEGEVTLLGRLETLH